MRKLNLNVYDGYIGRASHCFELAEAQFETPCMPGGHEEAHRTQQAGGLVLQGLFATVDLCQFVFQKKHDQEAGSQSSYSFSATLSHKGHLPNGEPVGIDTTLAAVIAQCKWRRRKQQRLEDYTSQLAKCDADITVTLLGKEATDDTLPIQHHQITCDIPESTVTYSRDQAPVALSLQTLAACLRDAEFTGVSGQPRQGYDDVATVSTLANDAY